VNDEILWKVLLGLLGVVTALLAWLGKHHVNKLEELDREAVRHHDLKELEQRITVTHSRMHVDNQGRFEELRGDIKDLRQTIERVLFRGREP